VAGDQVEQTNADEPTVRARIAIVVCVAVPARRIDLVLKACCDRFDLLPPPLRGWMVGSTFLLGFALLLTRFPLATSRRCLGAARAGVLGNLISAAFHNGSFRIRS